MAEGLSNVPDLAKQKEEISKYLNKKIEKGDTWYLVDTKWFKQWKKYVGYDNWDTGVVGERSSHPGPIDNSSLLKGNSSTDLKEHLIDDLDYILVPEEAWSLLVSWYGLAPGQEPIERKVIEYGMFVKHCRVEIYFTELKLCQMNDMEKCVTHKFSKIDTLESVEQVMREIFKIPPNVETRLWNKYNATTIERIENKSATLQELGIYQSTIIIEQKTPDGTWPKKTKSTSSSYSSSNGMGDSCSYSSQPSTITTRSFGNNVSNVSYYDYHGSSSVGAGLCGLGNLGNTCFMNSALQCMSNTPPLTQYFLKDSYWDELNIDNPLGMHGEIAKSYGELIKIIWSGQFAYTIPRNFKMVVGRFAPQFSGYQQQDCQELMAFLLDGLHEDLNRVKRKPYIEIKDAEGRPDHVVAKEAWDNYLKRNNSIIVDIFHGLLKSTLVCPDCSKVSVTFDPFCYLSLPLPIRKERLIEFIFVGLDPNKRPLQMKVSVPKQGYVSDLCEAASKLTGVPSDRLRVADVYSCRFHKVFQKEEPLSSILDRDEIFVYELPPTSCGDDDSSSLIAIPVYMREISIVKNGLNNCTNNLPQLFGQPFLIAIPSKNITYSTIYNAILQRLSRFVTIPDANENWWISSPLEPHNHNGGSSLMCDGFFSTATLSSPSLETIGARSGMPVPKPCPQACEGSDMDISNGVNCEEEETDELMVDDNEINEKIKDSLDNSPPGLFTIVGVNSFGNMNTEKFKNDGSPIELTSKSYIAIDWHPLAKQKFYNEKEAKEYEVHDSVSVQKLPNKKTALGLNECLELFTTVERLGAEDPWYCPACKKHQQATKKFDLWSLPNVLIIHLKRFSYNRYWRDKLDTMVDFPVRGLDMSRYLIDPSRQGPAIYDLIAVANHYGGMGGGHYTAYAKNAPTGQWHYFDDSSVTAASEDSLVTKAAYVLFYMKRGSEVISTIPVPPKSSSPEDDSFMDYNHTSTSSSSRSTPELEV